MKLDEVKEVREENKDNANNRLKEGFTLLKILKLANKDDESIVYVLGRK